MVQLDLVFHDGFNVICGANGVGKTTVLDIIAGAFTYSNSTLKRNASSEKGEYLLFRGQIHNVFVFLI